MHLKKPMSLIIRLNTVIIRETGFPVSSLTGGEFNNASVRGRSLFWYLSLFIMCVMKYPGALLTNGEYSVLFPKLKIDSCRTCLLINSISGYWLVN